MSFHLLQEICARLSNWQLRGQARDQLVAVAQWDAQFLITWKIQSSFALSPSAHSSLEAASPSETTCSLGVVKNMGSTEEILKKIFNQPSSKHLRQSWIVSTQRATDPRVPCQTNLCKLTIALETIQLTIRPSQASNSLRTTSLTQTWELCPQQFLSTHSSSPKIYHARLVSKRDPLTIQASYQTITSTPPRPHSSLWSLAISNSRLHDHLNKTIVL